MQMLHDPAVRRAMEARLDSLDATTTATWGRMSVDQMLWHVNQFLAGSLGERTLETMKFPMPRPLMKILLLYVPWPRSAPTNPRAIARATFDFDQERARCRELLGRFVALPVDGEWPPDPNWGRVDGRFASKLHAKHLDHHLRQFGV